MQETEGILKYGDIIRLTSQGLSLFSKGISSSSLKWLETPSNLDPCLSLFRVLPKSIRVIQTDLLTSDISKISESIDQNSEPLKIEIQSNISIYNKLSNNALTVGTTIELQHIVSNKFLGIDLKFSSRSDKDYLKFKLKEYPDINSLIKLEAVFNFQKEKVILIDGDKIYLEVWNSELSTNISMFVHNSKPRASLEQKSKIELVLCNKLEDSEESHIFNWSYVFIKDSENLLPLSISDREAFFSESFHLSSSLWQIESDYPGGIEPNKSYRIKHVHKKLYLQVRAKFSKTESLFSEIVSAGNSRSIKFNNKFEVIVSEDCISNSLWTFIPLNYNESSKFLKSQICALKNVETGLFLTMNFFQIEKCFPMLQEKISDFVYFQIFKCSEESAMNVAYADELISKLINLGDTQFNKIKAKHFKDLIGVLKDLESFCVNQIFFLMESNNSYGEVSKNRQDILKNQAIFEVLEKILGMLLPFIQEPTALQMSKSVFSLYVKLCKDNTENKLQLLYSTSTIKLFVRVDNYFSQSLSEIFKDFREAHSGEFKFYQELVKEHVESLIETRNIELFPFLSISCVCSYSAISSNQELIYEELVKNNLNVLILPKIKNSSFVFKFEQEVFLEDCFEGGILTKYFQEIDYFSATLELFSNLCYGRNYICIDSISEFFPSETLLHYIYNPKISEKVKANFLNLFLRIAIDVNPRFKINFPQLAYKCIPYTGEISNKMPLSKISPLSSFNSVKHYNNDSENSSVSGSILDVYIINLKEYVLEYLSSIDSASLFNLKILEISNFMLRMNLFKQNDNASENSKEKTKLLKFLTKIAEKLISKINFIENSDKQGNNGSKFNDINLLFRDRNENQNSPIEKYSKNLFKYLKYLKMPLSNKKDYYDDCLIEIINIFLFYLDWRQEKILKKIVMLNQKINGCKDFISLIPPITKSKFNKSNLSLISQKLISKVAILFMLTSNFKVKSLCLSFFSKSNNLIKETIDNVNKLLALTQPSDILALDWLKNQEREMRTLSEKSEVWITGVKNEDKASFELLLKQLNNLSNLIHEKSEVIENTIIEGGSKISSIRQKMYFNIKFHNIIISFVSENSHFLTKFPDIHILYQVSFNVIRKIIDSNKDYQTYFSKYVNKFLISLEYDLGQIETLIAIYKDNLELCTSFDFSILHEIKTAIVRHGRKARYLQLLKHIQVVDEIPLVENQIKVMNFLLDRKFYHVLCYSSGKDFIDFNFEVESEGDEPILYHAELINVLSLTSKGISEIELNEGKCRRIITLDKVFELLVKADSEKKFTSLKLPLLNFLFEVYLDSKFRTHVLTIDKNLLGLIRRFRKDFHEIDYDTLKVLLKIIRIFVESFVKAKKNKNFDKVYEEINRFFEGLNEARREKELYQFTDEDIENFYRIRQLVSCDFDLMFEKKVQLEDGVEFLQWESFKSRINADESLKNIIHKEKFYFSTNILQCGSDFSLKDFLNQLILVIKFHKIRKISKKIVCRSILIIKILVKDAFSSINSIKEFLSLNGIHILLKNLSEIDINPIVYNKLIKLCIVLLRSNNSDIQNSFFNYFSTVIDSEYFFKRIKSDLSSFKKNLNSAPSAETLKILCRDLKFLKLLCENHHNSLQDYLRFQSKSLNSFNFIFIILELLESLIKWKTFGTFDAISLCFDTLTEMCQGPCYLNQQAIIDSNFIEIITDLLGINEKSERLEKYEKLMTFKEEKIKEGELLKGWMIATLKYKSMITIHSLLEGNNNNYIVSRLIRAMNMDLLKINLITVYKNYYDTFKNEYSATSFERKTENFYFILEFGFLVYHLMRIFQENATEENKEIVSDILPELQIQEDALSYLGGNLVKLTKLFNLEKDGQKGEVESIEQAAFFFEKHTGNVDVCLKTNIIHKAYFWLNPECHNLTPEIKQKFHAKADRTSDKSKLIYLLAVSDFVIESIKHENFVERLILKNKLVRLTSNTWFWKFLAFISAIVLNFLILGYYSMYEYNSQILTLTQFGQNTDQNIVFFYAIEIIHLICSIMIFIFYYIKMVPILYGKSFRKHGKVLIALVEVQINFNTIYVSLYLIFSFFGCFIHVFYFAFHLLDFVYRYPTLQNVMRSLVLPYRSLIMIFIFILITVYLFSLVAYIYFYDYFLGNCDGLLLCALTCFDQGMKNQGGVGYYMYYNDMYVGNLHFPQFLFENAFNILMCIIEFNILYGIVISIFTVLREINEENEEDQKNKCFICGMHKDEIEERTKKPFNFHRKYEHSEWYYIFFILYLKNKDPSEFSGIESYVNEAIIKGNINWIPQGTGYSLQQKAEK